ncbi:MAG TPA: hypothetical protein VK645_15610, partial [Chitinophagaceae bacterium]|nr:hypothetical protein [Chitinophagaceae bacterium]
MKLLSALISFFMLMTCKYAPAQQINFSPGEIWKDTEGNTINAHGGGLLLHKGIYYWFGEIKKGETIRVAYV